MENVFNTPQYIDIETRISNTVNQVVNRGFDEKEELVDDYSELIERAEYRNAIIVAIYENYFPSKRHEFELQLITDIIEAVINSKIAMFTIGAAASGLIGNAFTNIVKRLLKKIIDGFKSHSKEKSKFETILKDVEKVESYFEKVDKEEINVLVIKTEIDRDRLIPILKLLGYKTYKKKNKRYWAK